MTSSYYLNSVPKGLSKNKLDNYAEKPAVNHSESSTLILDRP